MNQSVYRWFFAGFVLASFAVALGFYLRTPAPVPLPISLSASDNEHHRALAIRFQERLAGLERLYNYSSLEKLAMSKVYSREDVEAAQNAFDLEFTELFRHDPRGAIAMLASVSEPFRSECFRRLGHYFESKYANPEQIPVPKIKIDYFPKDLLSLLAPDVQKKMWNWLGQTDPEGTAAVLRGEVANVDPDEILPMLEPRSRQPEFIQAIVELAIQRPLSSDPNRIVMEACNLLSEDDLVRTAEIAFAADATVFRSLSRRLVEETPRAAMALLEDHLESPDSRARLIEELSEQGFDVPINGSEADRFAQVRGLMKKVLTERHDSQSIAGAIDRLKDMTDGAQFLTKNLDRALRFQAGDLSPILPALLQADAPFAMDSAGHFVGSWAKRDLAGVSAALATIIVENPIPDQILTPFIDQVHEDPEATVYWASHLQNADLRTGYYERAFAELEKTDPEAAKRLRQLYPAHAP